MTEGGWALSVLSALVALSLKAALLALGAWLIVLVSRTKDVGLRHAVWTTVLIGMLILVPFGYVTFPRLVLPIPIPSTNKSVNLESASTGEAPVKDLELSPEASGSSALNTFTRTENAESESGRALASWWPSLRWEVAMLAFYAIGLACLAVWTGLGWRRRKHVLTRTSPLDAAHAWESSHRLSALAGLRSSPLLLETKDYPVPFAFGLIRPRIVLPMEWRTWPLAQLESVLAHEIAHLVRGDTWIQALGWANRTLYWFHPAAIWLKQHLALLAEQRCDEMAIEWTGHSRTDYARHLMAVAASVNGIPSDTLFGGTQMAQTSQLSSRIHRLLDPPTDNRSRARRVTLALCSLLVLGGAALGFELQPVPGTTTETQGPEVKFRVKVEPRIRVHVSSQDQRERDPLSEQQERQFSEALMSPDAQVRTAAAYHLRRAPNLTDRTIERLLRLLADDTAVERPTDGQYRSSGSESALTTPGREAAATLGEIGPSIVPALDQQLRSSNSIVRHNATMALGITEAHTALESLAFALRDLDSAVRARAAWGMGLIESPDAIPYLADGARDEVAEVRENAAWSLGLIENAAAVETLAELLTDQESAVRAQSAWALGLIEDRSAVEPLSTALHDSDERVREQAAWALGLIEDRQAVPALSEALEDQSNNVRKQATWALGLIEDARALPALRELLANDEMSSVRDQAQWAVRQIEHR